MRGAESHRGRSARPGRSGRVADRSWSYPRRRRNARGGTGERPTHPRTRPSARGHHSRHHPHHVHHHDLAGGPETLADGGLATRRRSRKRYRTAALGPWVAACQDELDECTRELARPYDDRGEACQTSGRSRGVNGGFSENKLTRTGSRPLPSMTDCTAERPERARRAFRVRSRTLTCRTPGRRDNERKG